MNIEFDDGSLTFNRWEKVIYKGKEFAAPVESNILMAWDYIYFLLKNK